MSENTSRMLPQRWVMVLGAIGIFLAGLLVGAVGSGRVFAASQSPSSANTSTTALTAQKVKAVAVGTPFLTPQEAQSYCSLYEQTLVNDLKTKDNITVTASQLEGANYDAIVAVLNQMVTDKKLTQAQASQIEQQLAPLQSNVCQNLSQLGKGTAPTASQQQVFANARNAILSATAGVMGLTADQLQSQLKAGQTVAQIAASQHADITKVNLAYLGAVKQQLDAAATNGMLTSSQESQLYAVVQSAVNAGHYPLLDGGMSYGG